MRGGRSPARAVGARGRSQPRRRTGPVLSHGLPAQRSHEAWDGFSAASDAKHKVSAYTLVKISLCGYGGILSTPRLTHSLETVAWMRFSETAHFCDFLLF